MLIKQGKSNLKYLLIVVILAAVVGGGILGWQVVEGEEISNPLRGQPADLIKALFQWLLFLGPAVIFIFIWFLVAYFLIRLGFKILKIEEIPSRSKIFVFLFVTFLLSLFVTPTINKIFENVLNKPSLTFLNILIYLGITFSFLRYSFLLSGKKLWQFLLYLIVLNLIFSGIIALVQFL